MRRANKGGQRGDRISTIFHRKSFAQHITQLPAFEVRSSDRVHAQTRLADVLVPADPPADPSNDQCFGLRSRHRINLPETCIHFQHHFGEMVAFTCLVTPLLLDIHPLLREYFARQLRGQQHDAWLNILENCIGDLRGQDSITPPCVLAGLLGGISE